MNTGYIFNSGWWLSIDDTLFVFDYYTGTPPIAQMQEAKRVIVCATHSHFDHYSAKIFAWEDICDVNYVLSYDIHPTIGDNRHILRPGEGTQIDDIEITAFGSTDMGCSFHIKYKDKNIFHAGDLNLWHWKDESTTKEVLQATEMFANVINPLRSMKIDIAYFPVDSRIGTDYDEGARIFQTIFKPDVFCPMHFRTDYACLEPFEEWIKKYNPNTKFCRVTHKDQVFSLENI